jgi:hypothetical protein
MSSATSDIDTDFPRWRLAVVLAFGLAFYALTMWEVATGREDWPLSPYPMYSDIPGKTASRWLIMGVSDTGEFKLDDSQTAPFYGARLLSISKSLQRRPAKRAQFLHKVAERYEANRAGTDWPELRGIRFYSEVWHLEDGPAGMEHPTRELTSSTYFAPSSLLERLNAEAERRAAPEPAVNVPAGDTLIDLRPEQCESGCSPLADSLAAGGQALRLSPPRDGAASVVVHVDVPAGAARVFLRMRTAAESGSDRVRLELDGQAVGGKYGLGNYRDELTSVGWVWASAPPGDPPLSLEIQQPGAHVLRLSSTAAVDLDELWLSKSMHELPSDNRVRTP